MRFYFSSKADEANGSFSRRDAHIAPKLLLLLTSLFLLFLAIPKISHADDHTCIGHMELLSTTLEDLPDGEICDRIGAAYLGGLGVPPSRIPTIANPSFSDRYSYYFFFRLYLTEKAIGAGPDARNDQTAALLLGVSALADSSPAIDSEERKDLYRAFAIYSFATNLSAQSSSRRQPQTIVTAISDLLDPWKPISEKELICFVKHDIPTLSVDIVTSSQNFELCMLGD